MRTLTVNEASHVCGGLVGSGGRVGPYGDLLLSHTNTMDSGTYGGVTTWYTETGMCYQNYGELPPEPGLETVFTLPISWVGTFANWLMGSIPAPLPKP